jgi:hypothetical protein
MRARGRYACACGVCTAVSVGVSGLGVSVKTPNGSMTYTRPKARALEHSTHTGADRQVHLRC